MRLGTRVSCRARDLAALALVLATGFGCARPSAPILRDGRGGAPADLPEIERRIARFELGRSGATTLETSWLAERMQDTHTPSVSVAVINHGAIEWAHGYSALGTGEPVTTTETMFQAASISKPVSTFGVLRLVERGQLSLDDDVNVELRSWKVRASEKTRQHPVTLRAILSHSSGLNVHGFQGYAPGARLPSLPQILDGAPPANSAAVRVIFTPGSRQQYSGGGFVVLQQLVSDATQAPFAQTMTELVLAPLEMTHSVFAAQLSPELAPRAAQGHDAQGKPLPGKWHVYPQLAAAGLWTTPSDLAHFALLLEQARIGKSAVLRQASAELMTRRQFGSFALGFSVRGEGPNRAFMHSGVNAGYRCALLLFPERGQGAVVMTNGDGGAELVRDILRALGHIYGWPELPSEPHPW